MHPIDYRTYTIRNTLIVFGVRYRDKSTLDAAQGLNLARAQWKKAHSL